MGSGGIEPENTREEREDEDAGVGDMGGQLFLPGETRDSHTGTQTRAFLV